MTCNSTETDPQYVTKDPDSKLDFATRWSSWLAEDEVISDSDWILEVGADDETPLVIATDPAAGVVDGVATVWLTAGTLGVTYTLVNRITTDQGRTEDRTKYVTIGEH